MLGLEKGSRNPDALEVFKSNVLSLHYLMKKKDCQLSEVQEILLQLLRDSEVPQTDAIGIMLMLKDDEDTMRGMAIWIHENKPNDTEIMEWFGIFLKTERKFKI